MISQTSEIWDVRKKIAILKLMALKMFPRRANVPRETKKFRPHVGKHITALTVLSSATLLMIKKIQKSKGLIPLLAASWKKNIHVVQFFNGVHFLRCFWNNAVELFQDQWEVQQSGLTCTWEVSGGQGGGRDGRAGKGLPILLTKASWDTAAGCWLAELSAGKCSGFLTRLITY